MKKITFILIVFLLFIISSCSYNRYQDENFQYYKMKVSNEYVYAVTGLTEIGKSKNVLVFPNEYNGLKTYIKNSNLGPGSGKINSSNLKLFLPKEFTYVREDYFRFIYDEKNVNGTSKLIILSNDLENLNLNEVKYLKNIFVSNQIYKSMNNSNYSFNRANVSYNYNYNDSPDGGYYWIDDYDGEVISFVPPTPSRDGYTFMGWYKESECINEWNFNEDIVASKEFIEKEYIYNETTLYAKWKLNNIENNEISSHEHLICDECGKCLDINCNGEEADKCLGHTPKHEHVACPECGLCINSECDKEENKCLGHKKELYFIPIKERLLNFNIISDWLNSEYNEINEPYYDAYVKYENFYNILPNDYAKQKNMYLIETYTPIAFQLKSYKSLFIWNNGIINEIYKGKIKEIVHTAIIDSNKDGFDEILVSLNKNDNNSSIIIYDTKSNNYLMYDYTFKEVNENYLFFKSMDNQIAIYYNNKHDDETATTLYKNLIKNELVYKFNETEICASSIEWDIYIKIDEGNVNFPIFIDGTNLYFYTKTIMMYKGELFNYNKYLENRPGAKLIFMNDQLSSFKCNKTYNSDGVYHPDIVVENGEIIVESYYYEYKNGPRVLGDYELIFGFGATKNDQIIEQCLSINKLNLEENDYTSNHEHMICLECGKCTDTECHGTDGDNCQGHASKHEHVACPECGKCIDLECDGEEYAKCFGHNKELFFIPIKEKMINFTIINDWLNSKYNEINEPYYDAYVKYENFYNLLPDYYTKQKNIYLIETYSPNAYKLKESKTLFIWNNGEIKELYNGNIEEIVHIAIIDSNKDEHEEILISYNQSNIHSDIIIYDSKSNNFLISDYYFDEENQNYLFFKQNNNELSIVYNNVNNYYTANSLYKKIIKNEYEYTFYEKKLFIEGFDWDISIVLDEGSINFPIYIEDTKLYFYAKTILLYKGELYDYGYYQENRLGANLCFINNERTKFLCRKWYNSDGIYHPNNILTNGEIIAETYYYEQNVGDNVLGDYYLDVGFGLAIHNQLIYRCLNVSRLNSYEKATYHDNFF